MEKVRKWFRFTGEVQGVGFRYRAYQEALSHNVSGWVRNCYDGSVEMEAEGTEPAIEGMLAGIMDGRFVFIENTEVKSIPVTGSSIFKIR